MKFLDYGYKTEPTIITDKFENYKNYLIENKHHFPDAAYEFAAASWHYDPQDPRCPHDAWVESMQIFEQPLPESPQRRGRSLTIELTLLGAYHDGEIKIHYQNVNGYNLSMLPSDFEFKSHGDWLIDEIILSDRNRLVHEIRFASVSDWQIECEDIQYQWLPFDKINVSKNGP